MKRRIVILGFGVIITVVLGTVLLVRDNKPETIQKIEKTARDDSLGVNVRYIESLQAEQLSEQDKIDKLFLRLTSQNPPLLVTAKSETGLRQVSVLTRQDVLKLLLANAEKAYPARYLDYKLLSQKELEVNGKQAVELYFTYKGPSGELVKTRQLIVLKDENTAVYITAQAQGSIFDEVNHEYFESVFSSVNFD